MFAPSSEKDQVQGKDRKRKFLKFIQHKIMNILCTNDIVQKDKRHSFLECESKYQAEDGDSLDDSTICSENLMETNSRDRSSSLMSYESTDSAAASRHPIPISAPKIAVISQQLLHLFQTKKKPISSSTIPNTTVSDSIPSTPQPPVPVPIGLYEFFEDSEEEEEDSEADPIQDPSSPDEVISISDSSLENTPETTSDGWEMVILEEEHHPLEE